MTTSATLGQRYELGSLLGRGGMGNVHAATDLRLHREVAVKVLRADLAEQQNLRDRVEREARAAARINHPNVVAIYDIGENDGVPFIVMERLPGNSLADELAGGRLTQVRACALGIEILSALDAAHQLGVIHRDIKPANVLLDPLGHAKVADFGIAKIAEEDTETTMGMVLGTASYLAPERLAGHVATSASDLYAVGILLFEALAGRPPFRGDTPLAVVEAISRGVIVPLDELRPDVDPAVVAVVERAMRPDPEDRFASASDMGAALSGAPRSPVDPRSEPTVRIPTHETADVEPTRAMRAGERAAAPATVPTPVKTERRTIRLRARGLAAIGVLAILVAAAVLVDHESKSSAIRPGPVTPTTSPIPAPLERAIDALDHAVTP